MELTIDVLFFKIASLKLNVLQNFHINFGHINKIFEVSKLRSQNIPLNFLFGNTKKLKFNLFDSMNQFAQQYTLVDDELARKHIYHFINTIEMKSIPECW